jgi:hypothetical protein
VNKANSAFAVVVFTAGCAAPSANLTQKNSATVAFPTQVVEAGTTTKEVDVADVNRLRCEPVTRAGTRIVIGERCYVAGRPSVDEEALAEQLEQVRRDQEDLDRRRREAETRRGPGL